MYDDDSSGLESPDRPNASSSTDDTQAASLNPADRLERIDAQAERLLASLEGSHLRAIRRHVREIRAEAKWAQRLLCGLDLETEHRSGEHSPSGDGIDSSDETDDPSDNDTVDPSSSNPAVDVPMLVDRGGGVRTIRGPDPIAYQRWSEQEEPNDEREQTVADEPGRTAGDESDQIAGNEHDRTAGGK